MNFAPDPIYPSWIYLGEAGRKQDDREKAGEWKEGEEERESP